MTVAGDNEGAFVVVHRTFDPIEVEIVADILGQNGIEARAIGTRNGAIVGVGQGILEQRVEVREARAAEARELIAAFLETRPQEKEAPAERAGGAAAPPRRSALLAAGAVLVIFGGAHFYARRHWSGLVLALAQLVALGTMAGAGPARSALVAVKAAGLVAVGLLVIDLVGGLRAVRAWNRGATVSRGRQLATTGGLVLALALVAGFVAPRLPEPELEDEPPPSSIVVPADPGPDPMGDLGPLLQMHGADGGVVGAFGLPVAPASPPAGADADAGSGP